MYDNTLTSKIITVNLKHSLLLNASLYVFPLTYINEAPHLAATVT